MFTGVLEIGVILAVVVFLLSILSFRKSSIKSFPPGPSGLPFIGYLPFLGKQPHQVFYDLSKKYGPIISVQLGTKLVVVLNSLATIKEALGKPTFLGRPCPLPLQIADESHGFVDQNGQEWKVQRQFSFKVLQSLGFGTIRMEDYVKNEIFCLMEHLKSRSGHVIDVFDVINPSVNNVISALVFGRRLDIGDPKRIQLDNIAKATTPCFKQVASVYFFPRTVQSLLKFFSKLYEEGTKHIYIQEKILEQEVDSHNKLLDDNNPRDYIDQYLLEMKNQTNGHTYFNKENLVGNLRLFQGAGTDTILATLEWALLAMAAFPEVQGRVQEEMDSVIGKNRTPSYSDQLLMPYTQATILEVHRWRTNIPLNVLRSTTGATSVGGFDLPANTIVLANLWVAHNDPHLWDSPQDFRPDRFLSKDTGLVDAKKSDMLATFSFGPRACPGKALANLEIFLFIVSILQRFRLTLPEGVKPLFDGVLEISYKPLQTQLVFCERF